MKLTATQKILLKHTDNLEISEGDLISANVDIVMGNDITAPVAISEFEKVGDTVFDADKIVLVLDHFCPAKDIKSAQQCKKVREFALKHKISHFYDVGKAGIEHALLPEQGLVIPSSLIIGADSHTCTYGALGCFSTGVGSTDMAAAMLNGKAWFKVPKAINIRLKGNFKQYVTGKDLILHIIGLLGVDGATYMSLEFSGNISALSMDDRFTICNMAVECGAKNAFIPIDKISEQYLLSHTNLSSEQIKQLCVSADTDANYEKVLEINLDELSPCVAYPNLPSNVRTLNDFDKSVKVDQVVIGSCTNGRMTDMRQAAEILNGKRIADGMRLIIIPATQKIYKRMVDNGLINIFIDCGAVVSTPTCGPCLGGYMGILAENETCVATTNRNFVGRMGHVSSKVYLASPYVAAQSALKGYLCSPTAQCLQIVQKENL